MTILQSRLMRLSQAIGPTARQLSPAAVCWVSGADDGTD